MELGVVIGQVVSTAKCPEMHGDRLLVVNLVDPTREKGSRVAPNPVCHVAVDAVGAGVGEWVLLTRGSSARLANKSPQPVDLSIVGIVDEVVIGSEVSYTKRDE